MSSREPFKLEQTEYDAIFLSTGVVDSLLSSAFSSAGKNVIHIDKCRNYGGSTQSPVLKDFISLLKQSEKLQDRKTTEQTTDDKGDLVIVPDR